MISDVIVFMWLKGKGYVPAARVTNPVQRNRLGFKYGKKYTALPNSIPVDPVTLPLFRSEQVFTTTDIPMFSALRDMAPDKWGRKLIYLMAGKHSETLSELDILTAIHSKHRIGALAFGRSPDEGPVSMASWAKDSVQVLRLEDLDRIVQVIEAVDNVEDDDEMDALRLTLPEDDFLQALASSLSLGGGRPKALVFKNGEQFIAKFSKRGDLWNEPRIEYATMTLAKKCGIQTVDVELLNVHGTSVLLVKRFDRDNDMEPKHFVSGFTMKNVPEDGAWGSYQDLAQIARQYADFGAGPELFRRMVFNIICANVDDHLRNHAFFVDRNSVSLTPAYDIVPTQIRVKEKFLALGCGFHGRVATIENALSEVEPFGLRQNQAQKIVDDIVCSTVMWRKHFADCGVTKRELEELESRFDAVNC